MSELSTYLDELSADYLALHTKKEDAFWEAKMGLGTDPALSQKKCSEAEIAVSKFIQDAGKLRKLRELEKEPDATADEKIALKGWRMFLEANMIEDPKAQELAANIIEMEGALLVKRGG